MRKLLIQAFAILTVVMFTGTGCIDMIQFNLFKQFEKPNLSAENLAESSDQEILDTAEALNDSGDADTYTDEEVDNLIDELDQIIDNPASSNDELQAAAAWAGNIILAADGGDDVINRFVGQIPTLQQSSPDIATVLDVIKGCFGPDISRSDFDKAVGSILDAAVYYRTFASALRDINDPILGDEISSALNEGEVAQFAAFSIILRRAITGDPSELFDALYPGDSIALDLLVDESAFDVENLDIDAEDILNAAGLMSLIQG